MIWWWEHDCKDKGRVWVGGGGTCGESRSWKLMRACIDCMIGHDAPRSRHTLDARALRLAILEPYCAIQWCDGGREDQEVVVGSQQLGDTAGQGFRDCGEGAACGRGAGSEYSWQGLESGVGLMGCSIIQASLRVVGEIEEMTGWF